MGKHQAPKQGKQGIEQQPRSSPARQQTGGGVARHQPEAGGQGQGQASDRQAGQQGTFAQGECLLSL